MDLSLVIVNWNAGSLLRACLDALPAAVHGAPASFTYEVFVVDQASADDSLAEARKSRQPFTLIALQGNAGFARANNLALRRATGTVVLLLNPDAEPRPGSLAALLVFFAQHPRAGVVGGTLLYPDGRLQRSVRTFPTLLVLALLLTRVARLLRGLPSVRRYEMDDFSYAHAAVVDQVMGAAFAVRRAALAAIGYLDERYWIWFEEVDFCRRMVWAGWDVWYTPLVETIHHQAASFRRVPAWRRSWWFARSAVQYARKHLGFGSAVALALLVPAHLATGVLASVAGADVGVLRSRERF